jgi:hypothetical protein
MKKLGIIALGTWSTVSWQGRIEGVVVDERMRAAYDRG